MMRRLHDDEGGAVLALYALSFVAILGMLALTLDLGRGVAVRRDMVNAADAAALGAAQECAVQHDTASAQGVANGLTTANRDGATVSAFSAPDCEVTPLTSPRTVTVQTQATMNYFVAPILGFNDVEVRTSATALYGPLDKVYAAPISVNYQSLVDCFILPYDKSNPPRECTLAYPKDTLQEPRWGILDLAHWNDPDAAPCHVSSSEAQDRITGPDSFPFVELNDSPPTYDCVDNGLSDAVWETLEGRTLIFPVIDLDGGYSGFPSTGETKHGQEDCTAALDDPLRDDCQIDTMNVVMWLELTVPAGGVTKHGDDVSVHVHWTGGSMSTSGLPGNAPDTGVYGVRLVD